MARHSIVLMNVLRIDKPLIVAPMAGGPSSPELVAAASNAGALGSMGAAYSTPQGIAEFAATVRAKTDRPFAINLFAPHAQPALAQHQVDAAIRGTARYRNELGLPTPRLAAPFEENFDLQFEAVLRAKPIALSFVFGLLPAEHLKAAQKENIAVIGTATTPDEAARLEDSGVDAMVLQGVEAGGHRGLFDPQGKDEEIGLQALLDAVVRNARIPLIAAGGLMTAADIQAALAKGAQAVQMGTAFLTCEEAGTSPPYRRVLSGVSRRTKTTRVFSGRLARGIENRFMLEMEDREEMLLPFPAQNKLTRDLRTKSAEKGMADFLSLWCGTGVGELWQGTAAELIESLFSRN